jgi:hypothetical protein
MTLSASFAAAGPHGGGGGGGGMGGHPSGGALSGNAVAGQPTQVNSSGNTHASNSGNKPSTKSKVYGSCVTTASGQRHCSAAGNPLPQTGTNGPSHGGVDNPSLKPK